MRLLSAIVRLLVLLALAAPAVNAAARDPQVPVTGSALQSFFTSQGQTIDVHAQQLDLQRTAMPIGSSFTVHPFGPEAATTSFGVYNAALASSPLYQILPGSMSPGWFVAASYRPSPVRLVVNLFDNTSAFVGVTTYLGADPADQGFYLAGPGGTFYSPDERNLVGARILAFNGTGAREGYTWFACETGPGPGGDYADVVFLVQLSLAPTNVEHWTWGALKQRFR